MRKAVVTSISWQETVEAIRQMATTPTFTDELKGHARIYDAEILEAAARNIRQVLEKKDG